MNPNDFAALSERFALALLQSNYWDPSTNLGETAVLLAEQLVEALEARKKRVGQDSKYLTANEISEIRRNRLISAIKMVRDRTGLNLKAAKALVDKAMAELGPERGF